MDQNKLDIINFIHYGNESNPIKINKKNKQFFIDMSFAFILSNNNDIDFITNKFKTYLSAINEGSYYIKIADMINSSYGIYKVSYNVLMAFLSSLKEIGRKCFARNIYNYISEYKNFYNYLKEIILLIKKKFNISIFDQIKNTGMIHFILHKIYHDNKISVEDDILKYIADKCNTSINFITNEEDIEKFLLYLKEKNNFHKFLNQVGFSFKKIRENNFMLLRKMKEIFEYNFLVDCIYDAIANKHSKDKARIMKNILNYIDVPEIVVLQSDNLPFLKEYIKISKKSQEYEMFI